LIEKKGIRQLIEAMPAIVRSVPQASLLILGRDTRDAGFGRSYAARLGAAIPAALASKITFGGEVDPNRLRELMASAAVCAFPSHMEAMPIAWLEAMAMGKAVVASESGPGPEVIRDGISGLLCNPHDFMSIAGKVIVALSDVTLRARLGEAARQRAVDEFSLQAITRRNLDFYRACADDTRRATN
jgi:glycosyltransferase involved in cell wall biosynthesis